MLAADATCDGELAPHAAVASAAAHTSPSAPARSAHVDSEEVPIVGGQVTQRRAIHAQQQVGRSRAPG